MTIIPKEELDQYAFNLLPNNVYFEVVQFKLAGGRAAKVLLAAPTKECTTGKTPSYIVVIRIDPSWVICPWISDDILAVLSTLIPPSASRDRVPEDTKPFLAS